MFPRAGSGWPSLVGRTLSAASSKEQRLRAPRFAAVVAKSHLDRQPKEFRVRSNAAYFPDHLYGRATTRRESLTASEFAVRSSRPRLYPILGPDFRSRRLLDFLAIAFPPAGETSKTCHRFRKP